MWNLKKFAETNRFKCIFEFVWKGNQHSNPQLNACIILLRNNDAKIEKRFAFEISSSESNAEPYVPQLLWRNNVKS